MGRTQNQPLVHSLGMLVPAIALVVASLITSLPVAPRFGAWTAMPSLPVIVVFLWAVWRPDFLPPYLVLGGGLFHDLATSGPIGMWAVILLAVYSLVLSQRVYLVARHVLGLWAGFAFVAFFASMIIWTLVSVLASTWLNPGPFLLDALMLVLVFPVGRLIVAWSLRFVGPAV